MSNQNHVALKKIETVWLSLYGRPPLEDNAWGLLTNWQSKINDLSPLAAQLMEKPEFAQQPGSAGTAQLVDQVYLILYGRHVEPADLQWWLDTASQHHLSNAQLVLEISKGAQNNDAEVLQDKQSANHELFRSMAYADSRSSIGRNDAPVLDAARNLLQGVKDDLSLQAVQVEHGKID